MSTIQLSEAQVQAIGEALKSAREKRGDNLAEAAFRIALSPAQLRAIEAGDLRPFYGHNYFLQAARRYANLLGIDLPSLPANSQSTPLSNQPPAVAAADEPTIIAHVPQGAPSVAVVQVQDHQNYQTAPISSQSPTITPESTLVATEARHRQPGLRWGWIALAAGALITIGILKISFEQPPRQETVLAPTQPPALPVAEDNKPSVVAAAAAAPEAASPASPQQSPPAQSTSAQSASKQDGRLDVQTSTWVQIVKNNGEKTNLKAEPGQRIEFSSGETAALVFGQPEKANLTIQGKPINLLPFITQDSPPRALVILNRISQ